jgi:hypothetical protein
LEENRKKATTKGKTEVLKKKHVAKGAKKAKRVKKSKYLTEVEKRMA